MYKATVIGARELAVNVKNQNSFPESNYSRRKYLVCIISSVIYNTNNWEKNDSEPYKQNNLNRQGRILELELVL